MEQTMMKSFPPDQILMMTKIQTKQRFLVSRYFASTSIYFFNYFLLNTGGGKDLATAASFGKTTASQAPVKMQNNRELPNATVTKTNSTKLPSGIVTKPNTTGYDVIKPSLGQGMSLFFNIIFL